MRYKARLLLGITSVMLVFSQANAQDPGSSDSLLYKNTKEWIDEWIAKSWNDKAVISLNQPSFFKFTKHSPCEIVDLDNLKEEDLPVEILEKLEALGDQKLKTEGEFLKAVEKAIGNDQTVRYKELILEHVLNSHLEAEHNLRCAVQFYKRVKPTSPHLATTLYNLAGAYFVRDKYKEAEPRYKEALEIRARFKLTERSLDNLRGDRLPDEILENLKSLKDQEYKKEDEFLVAVEQKIGNDQNVRWKELILKHVETRINVPELNPSDVAAMRSLADIYAIQKEYDKAKPLYEKVESFYKDALGKLTSYQKRNPSDVAAIMRSFADIYAIQKKYDEAKQLYKDALKELETVPGWNPLDMATILNSLAGLYLDEDKYDKEKYDEAVRHYKRAWEIGRYRLEGAWEIGLDKLAEEKFDARRLAVVLQSLHGLALLNDRQLKFKKAETFYMEARKTYKDQVVTSGQAPQNEVRELDQIIAMIEINLGGLYYNNMLRSNLKGLDYDKKNYNKVESSYKRALELQEVALGPNHLDVAVTLTDLAKLYRTPSPPSEDAEKLYKRALEIRKAALRKKHPDVAASQRRLADFYMIQDKYEEAQPLYKDALEILKEDNSKRNRSDMARILNGLATLHLAREEYDKAEPYINEALEIWKEIQKKNLQEKESQ